MPTNPMRTKHIRNLPSPRVAPSPQKPTNVPYRERSDYCLHNNPNRVYTGKMTDKKRQHAKSLLKREELRNNRQKLIQIICQKLSNRFKRVPKNDIRRIVNKFVSTKVQINANDLTDLENEVQAFISEQKKRKEESNLPDVNNKTSSEENGEGNVFQSPRESNGSCTCVGCKSGSKCVVLPKGREWEALNLFQSYQSTLQEKKEEEEHRKKQRELKATLDKQMKELKNRREAEKSSDKEYLKALTEDLEKYNEENAAKQEKLNAKLAREKAFWEQQIADEAAARKREKEALIKEEQRDLNRMQQKLAAEKRLMQQKKEREAEFNRMIQQENARNKILHQQQVEKEKEEDNRIMAEYARRLDAEEKRRQDVFNKRMSDLEKFAKMADEGAVGKGRREEERREEELLLKQQLAKEQADAERERKDIREKRERDLAMAAQNKKILEEKAAARKRAEEEDREFSEQFKRMGREFQEEKNRMKQREQDKCLQQRRALQEQMDSKRRETENMNAVERSINSDLIENIREDSNFQSRLQHRVRMARSRPNTPGSARGSPRASINGLM